MVVWNKNSHVIEKYCRVIAESPPPQAQPQEAVTGEPPRSQANASDLALSLQHMEPDARLALLQELLEQYGGGGTN